MSKALLKIIAIAALPLLGACASNAPMDWDYYEPEVTQADHQDGPYRFTLVNVAPEDNGYVNQGLLADTYNGLRYQPAQQAIFMSCVWENGGIKASEMVTTCAP